MKLFGLIILTNKEYKKRLGDAYDKGFDGGYCWKKSKRPQWMGDVDEILNKENF